jgi:nucleoside-diphosphate-sugar epimerase
MNFEAKFGGIWFDVGTGESTSLNEVKDFILKHHPEVEFDYIPSRRGDVEKSRARTEPLRRLGWESSISIEQGLSECFAKGEKNEIRRSSTWSNYDGAPEVITRTE